MAGVLQSHTLENEHGPNSALPKAAVLLKEASLQVPCQFSKVYHGHGSGSAVALAFDVKTQPSMREPYVMEVLGSPHYGSLMDGCSFFISSGSLIGSSPTYPIRQPE